MDSRLRMEDDPLGRGTQGKQEEPSFLMSDMPEGAQMGVRSIGRMEGGVHQ